MVNSEIIMKETLPAMELTMMRKASAMKNPIHGSLELTPICNMNCDMCYIRLSPEEMIARGQLRTVREWTILGEQMQRAGVLFLLLTGGEPLLYPDFKELFINLKKMGMILTVNTNGTLINEDWADFFAQNPPRRINITLYGSNTDTYDQLCHYPEGFEKVLRGLRLLKDRSIDLKISSSLTSINHLQMKQIISIGDSLQIPVRIDTYMMPSLRQQVHSFSGHIRLDPETAAECQMESLRLELSGDTFYALISKYVWEADHLLPDTHPLNHSSCYAGRCSFSVNWQGKLRPCVIMTNPSAEVFTLGFESAWQSVSQQMNKICLCGECGCCRLRSMCRNCAAGAYLETGRYDARPDYICRYTKKLYQLMKQEVNIRLHA